MAPTAAYDAIADWYEQEFLGGRQARSGTPDGDPLGIDRALGDLLGQGSGACLEVGCGTGHWTTASWTDQGVRAKVGVTHRPLPELLHGFLAAGLALERFAEGGAPTPAVLAIRARKPRETRGQVG